MKLNKTTPYPPPLTFTRELPATKTKQSFEIKPYSDVIRTFTFKNNITEYTNEKVMFFIV